MQTRMPAIHFGARQPLPLPRPAQHPVAFSAARKPDTVQFSGTTPQLAVAQQIVDAMPVEELLQTLLDESGQTLNPAQAQAFKNTFVNMLADSSEELFGASVEDLLEVVQQANTDPTIPQEAKDNLFYSLISAGLGFFAIEQLAKKP